MLAAADLALTRAQEQGPDTYDLIALAELDRRGRGSLAWREHIEGAIDTGKLALYTQAVLSLPARALMQSEVVSRLLDDGSSPVAAAQFLPMAARHGLLPRYIKLAPAYTNELTQNQDSRFIVSSLIRIAQPLEIGIIAQAVESDSLIQLLQEMGFAGYQGYANGRPAPIG